MLAITEVACSCAGGSAYHSAYPRSRCKGIGVQGADARTSSARSRCTDIECKEPCTDIGVEGADARASACATLDATYRRAMRRMQEPPSAPRATCMFHPRVGRGLWVRIARMPP